MSCSVNLIIRSGSRCKARFFQKSGPPGEKCGLVIQHAEQLVIDGCTDMDGEQGINDDGQHIMQGEAEIKDTLVPLHHRWCFKEAEQGNT